MKTPQNVLIPLLFFAVIAMSATDCNPSTNVTSQSEAVSDKWILGRVELPADETSWGLIGFSKSDVVHWILYQHGGTSLELHDTVYFRIQHLQVDSGKVAFASDVTTTRPSEICSGGCIANAWINGVSFLPHKMFTHVGGRTYHRPGHVIQSSTPSESISLQIIENGEVLQTQEFQLKVVQYQQSNEEEPIYLPTEWLPVLSDSTTNYYMDFYDDKVNDKRVLRSYSIEHSHPGHISNITLKLQ